MIQPIDIPFSDDLDLLAGDLDEIRDLIQTTPLRYGDDGLPVGYEAEQLFGLEGASLAGRFL